jgi:hypothetical protein
MGWAELENGELLAAAQREGFEVMVTGDQNLSYQQNLAGRTLAVIVLSTNNWNIIKVNPVPIIAALAVVQPGDFRFVAL